MTTTVQTRRRLLRDEEPEWLVWVLVLVLLSVGLMAKMVVTGQTQAVSQGSAALTVPARWAVLSASDGTEPLQVSEPLESSVFPASVTVNVLPLADMTDDAEATLGDLALKWTNRQTQDLQSYKVLSIEPALVKGQNAVKVNYVYVTEPGLVTPNSIPVVAEGQDVLLRQGDNVVVIAFVSDADDYEAKTGAWNRILNSLELK